MMCSQFLIYANWILEQIEISKTICIDRVWKICILCRATGTIARFNYHANMLLFIPGSNIFWYIEVFQWCNRITNDLIIGAIVHHISCMYRPQSDETNRCFYHPRHFQQRNCGKYCTGKTSSSIDDNSSSTRCKWYLWRWE